MDALWRCVEIRRIPNRGGGVQIIDFIYERPPISKLTNKNLAICTESYFQKIGKKSEKHQFFCFVVAPQQAETKNYFDLHLHSCMKFQRNSKVPSLNVVCYDRNAFFNVGLSLALKLTRSEDCVICRCYTRYNRCRALENHFISILNPHMSTSKPSFFDTFSSFLIRHEIMCMIDMRSSFVILACIKHFWITFVPQSFLVLFRSLLFCLTLLGMQNFIMNFIEWF